MYIFKKNEVKKGTTLQHRLFVLISLITLSVIMLFWLLLIAFGITGSGRSSVHKLMDTELIHLTEDINENFGKLSLKGIEMSKQISESISESNSSEEVLAKQMPTLLNTINNNYCSGVFFALNSSDGIFLKRTQTASVQPVNSKILYLRGPASIARNNKIELLGQWKMKFDKYDMSIFENALYTARNNPDLQLSRLYYWTKRITLTDNSESGFLLCVPVECRDNIIGICGIEVSDRMFKYKFCPNTTTYNDMFSVLAPIDSEHLHADKGMVAGNYFLTSTKFNEGLFVNDIKGDFSKFESDDGCYGGLLNEINMYPSDSPYKSEKWSVAVMLPDDTLQETVRGKSLYLFVIVLLLFIMSIIASVIVSRQYIKPLNCAIDRIKGKQYITDNTNTYAEINDLMEYLESREKDKSIVISAPKNNINEMFDEFVKNIKTLSPAEKNVFDMYIKGCKAQEIADELHLSINTIKTHNRRIFAKLNVSTRKELLVYIDMMREMKIINEID